MVGHFQEQVNPIPAKGGNKQEKKARENYPGLKIIKNGVTVDHAKGSDKIPRPTNDLNTLKWAFISEDFFLVLDVSLDFRLSRYCFLVNIFTIFPGPKLYLFVVIFSSLISDSLFYVSNESSGCYMDISQGGWLRLLVKVLIRYFFRD